MTIQNPFTVFDLPVEFDIDLNKLNQQYLVLQKENHPDNYALANSDAQLVSVQNTANINDAYQALKDPIRRAEAILQIALQQEVELEKIVQDTAFLMQQLVLREELESISDSKDQTALESLRKQSKVLWSEHIEIIQSAVQEKDWDKVKQVIDRLKFIKKLNNEIDQLEEQFYE